MTTGRPIGIPPPFGLLRESALVAKEPALALDSARVAGEPGIAADKPMAGNDDGHGIECIGVPHRSRCGGTSEAGGKPSVARGLARRDLSQRPPDRLLEGRAAEIHRDRVDGAKITREVRLELFAGSERISPAAEGEASEPARQVRGQALFDIGEL